MIEVQTEVMWALLNRHGVVCYVLDRRAEAMDKAEEIWGRPWRTIRRRGDMAIARVRVSAS